MQKLSEVIAKFEKQFELGMMTRDEFLSEIDSATWRHRRVQERTYTFVVTVNGNVASTHKDATLQKVQWIMECLECSESITGPQCTTGCYYQAFLSDLEKVGKAVAVVREGDRTDMYSAYLNA